LFARNGVSAPGPLGLGAPPLRLLCLAVAVVLLAAGCGQQTGSPVASPPSLAGKVSISRTDRAACGQLLGRLQQVTLAIGASSELIANSVDTQQLSQRIADEALQLRQAADLMASGPVPAPLMKANQDLVAALRTLTNDFERAKNAAALGDLRTAVDAMRDEPSVQRIVDASTTIEDSCQ
jgi:hypothetical protein